jgi:hypothetical protein
MGAAEKVRFCEEWYARGVCPGCGAALTKVAGTHLRHFTRDHRVAVGSNSDLAGRYRVPGTTQNHYYTRAGDVATGGVGVDDPRVCRYTGDDLTSLVLIGSGTVKAR